MPGAQTPALGPLKCRGTGINKSPQRNLHGKINLHCKDAKEEAFQWIGDPAHE
jgi:hypothetical protein